MDNSELNLENITLMPAEPIKFITESGIDKAEGESIIKELKAKLQENESLLALGAPQLGINKRIFGIKFNDGIKIFINPIITKKQGSIIAGETCYGLPGKEIIISRPEELTIVYYTEDFVYEDNKLLGLAARLFDQQYQLLDGVLPTELGLVSDIATDGSIFDLSDTEFEEVKQIYAKFIKTKITAIDKEITANSDMAKQYAGLKFTESVVNGRTTILTDDSNETNELGLNRKQRRQLKKIKFPKKAGGNK